VGTAPQKVMPSSRISSNRLAPSSFMPGRTILAPVPAAANGIPQQLTWNNGAHSSSESRAEIAMVSAAISEKLCSTAERWLCSTPFGLPVVPDV
jgi:hypothetical protein